MTKFLSKIAAAFLTIFLLGSQLAPVFAALAPLRAYAGDTVAGYGTSLATSRGNAHEQVTFRIKNPLNTIVDIPATTNELGIAETDLAGFHTKYAGKYMVAAFYRSYESEQPALTTFTVYPDVVSSGKSTLTVNSDSVAADGTDQALVTVQLQDKNGNAVSGHQVTLISSRPEDIVTTNTPDEQSNANGEVVFTVTSQTAGVSYLTALDRNSGNTLSTRGKIIFFEADQPKSSSSSGNSMLGANVFGGDTPSSQPSGPVTGFKLDFKDGNNNPNVASVGNDTNYFTVTAVDANAKTVTDYTGTILIATDDEAAVIPNNGQYTFRPQDQGSFQFALAFQFARTGQQKITVYGYDPDTGTVMKNIRGELTVDVKESGSTTPAPDTGGSADLTIKSPENGSKYASTDITVTGKGPKNSALKLFLDGVDKGTANVDSDGIFIMNLSSVSNGSHEVYVQKTEADRGFSDKITFSVDTTPSTLEDIKLTPAETLKVGESLTVTVVAEAALPDVTIQLNGVKHVLREDATKSGNYEVSFPVPEAPGPYPIDVFLTDKLGNESKFLSQATLTVEAGTPVLTAPQNVQASATADGVVLTWDPLENVALYMISGGTSELNTAELKSVASNKTTATITGLTADTDYVFTLKAMDTSGNFSPASTTVRAHTLPDTAIGNTRLSGQAQDSAVLLNWQPSATTPDSYLVRYGIKPANYVEEISVSGLKNALVIPDLINGIPYYFTILAVQNGQTMYTENYGEITLTPVFGGLHPAAETPPFLANASNIPPRQNSSGPEASVLFVGISFLITALFVFRRGVVGSLAMNRRN